MRFFYVAIFMMISIVGCSSDNSSDNEPKKNENPVDTYMKYNKDMMKKPQEVQQELDRAMKQHEDIMKEAEKRQLQ